MRERAAPVVGLCGAYYDLSEWFTPMIGKDTLLYDVTEGEFLANVDAIGQIDHSRQAVDTTEYSTSEQETSMPGLKRTAPITVRLNYEPFDEGVARLVDRYEAREIADYLLIFPDHSTYSFRGYVLALGQEQPKADLLRRSFRFQPDGTIEPILICIAPVRGTTTISHRGSRPGDDYPEAPPGSCAAAFDISEWYT